MKAFVGVNLKSGILSEENLIDCLEQVGDRIERVPIEAIDAVVQYRMTWI
jgi:hypothetical protein